jgi:dipeptidyl aminopeptidase/acylaminoacyl peptidase
MRAALHPRPTVRIFVNYRREDTAGYAGWLYEALAARFGSENVFMDVDTIAPGEDFHEVLGRSVGACDVLVALIGREWLTVKDKDAKPRIESPDDWVRIEIESALARDVKVIPALVEGARPLTAEQLPETLRPLAARQAIELTNARWRYDVGRLIGAIGPARRRAGPGRGLPGRRVLAVGLALAAVAAAGIAIPLVVLSGSGALGRVGDIAFTRNDGIYRMDADGTHVVRLYETGKPVAHPVWSPDAKRIAFTMDGDVWLLRPGGKIENLTNDSGLAASSPTWSPDGKQIAFAAVDPGAAGKSGIAIVDATGGTARFLTDDTFSDGSPAWSPDGTQIVFTTRRGKPLELDIYAVTLSDSAVSPLVSTKADAPAIYDADPTWSPDGKQLAFDTNVGTHCIIGCEIETLTLATSALSVVASPPDVATLTFGGGYSSPKWIDKSTLMFSYDNGVWTIPASGGLPAQIGRETDVSYADVATAGPGQTKG